MKSQYNPKPFSRSMDKYALHSAIFYDNDSAMGEGYITYAPVDGVSAAESLFFETPFRFVPMAGFLFVGYNFMDYLTGLLGIGLASLGFWGTIAFAVYSLAFLALFSNIPMIVVNTFSLSYKVLPDGSGKPKRIKQFSLFFFTAFSIIASYAFVVASTLFLVAVAVPFALEKSKVAAAFINALL